jgi:hypothetical protein
VFARLHESRWVEGAGAFLLASEVDPVFTGTLPEGAGPAAVGVDLGLARDAAVAAVARRHGDGLVVIEALETWTPRNGQRVDLQEVEDAVAVLAARTSAPVIADPWQGALMGQRLRARGVRVEEFSFTAEGRRRLFSVLLDLIRGSRLRSRPHEALRRELLGLEVQETSAGWRVDHRTGQHDDHVVAVALAAQHVAPQFAVSGPIHVVSREQADVTWRVAHRDSPWW